MDNEKTKEKVEFYGGKVGPWIPVICMVVGMMVGTYIGGGGMLRHFLLWWLDFCWQKIKRPLAGSPSLDFPITC